LRSTLLLLALMVVTTTASGADPDGERRSFDESMAKIGSLTKARDLDGLKMLAEQIQTKWAADASGARYYGPLMVEMVAQLGSRRFNGMPQRALSRAYARTALARGDQLSLDNQTVLVEFLLNARDESEDAARDTMPNRSDDAVLALQVWKRLKDSIDPTFDPVKDTPRTVMPPAGVPAAVGLSPDSINDPELREKYRAELAEERKRGDRYVQQMSDRELDRTFSPKVEDGLVRLYSLPPSKLDELKAHLEKFVPDGDARERMMGRVEKNLRAAVPRNAQSKMEEEMRLRRMNDTGAASGGTK